MKLGSGLFFLSLLISFIILNPSIRKNTARFFLDSQREILSHLEFERNQNLYKVVKVKNLRGLSLEIYKKIDESFVLMDAEQLTDKSDAFYKFDENGQHNLFLKDLSGNGEAEIILPSLDKNMKARLNVFSFDPENEELIKLSQH